MAMDANTQALTNKKITELKKKILLSEGQKKAYSEEWREEQKFTSDMISTLKNDIKELTAQVTELQIPGFKKSRPMDFTRKCAYPPGAKTAEEAVCILDLKAIELKKQMDLIHDKYLKRQKVFNKLVDEYQILMAYKKQKEDVNSSNAETVEEDANRKLICHLENEIHRTSVQWMEAEHIRKKYRSIKASLMNDSEKFERSLLELEQALQEQQVEINKLQEINSEALQMRDATKLILQRQEQSAHSSTRARDRQALDFRRLVDERKIELERLERKIFSTGKTLAHQDSVGSSSGDQLTGNRTDHNDSSSLGKDGNSELEIAFRKLMEATGATIPNEVLTRFLSQREATSRLNYLRTSTEAEKKQLENQRDKLNSQLEAYKFADIKENEVNQEEMEKVKLEIAEERQKMLQYQQSQEHTDQVTKEIRDALIELLLKLQEIDEYLSDLSPGIVKKNPTEYDDQLLALINNNELLHLLEEKLKLGMASCGQFADNDDSGVSDDEMIATPKIDELNVPIPTPSSATTYIVDDKEKPLPFPSCYFNLMSGRATTTQVSSASPGQSMGQANASDDEGDVPSRTYLKRQAQMIIDAKSRRKGFRPPVSRKK